MLEMQGLGDSGGSGGAGGAGGSGGSCGYSWYVLLPIDLLPILGKVIKLEWPEWFCLKP